MLQDTQEHKEIQEILVLRAHKVPLDMQEHKVIREILVLKGPQALREL